MSHFHTLSAFTSHMSKGKFARQYNYDVWFTSPPGMPNPTREMLMRCEQFALPGQNLETSPDTLHIGPIREHAFGVNYGPVSAVFLCDDELSERRFFENWQRLMFDSESYRMGYYNDYVTDMTVNQYNDKEELTYSLKLFEVFPKTITELGLTTTAGELHRLTVELVYHHWKPLQVAKKSPLISGVAGQQDLYANKMNAISS